MNPTAQPIHRHAGFRRAFAPGHLTLGFILPLEGYPDGPAPTMRDHAETTRLADQLGFAALWARDVPTYDPDFGDVAQVFDPFAYLGFLAAHTTRIALGTGATVITLRHPVLVAKQAASVDVLSGGRLLLGVASGDRPAEYPLFNLTHDFECRGERFQEALAMIRLASEGRFPRGRFARYGTFGGNLEVVPKPHHGRLPTIVVGRSRQELPWIAENADGWFHYFADVPQSEAIGAAWRDAVAAADPAAPFKPLAQGFFFDLLPEPGAAARPIRAGMAAGRNALIAHLAGLRRAGIHHVGFNLKASRRPVVEVLHELAEFVLPEFPSL